MRLQKLTDGWFPIEGDPDGTEFKVKHLRSGEIKKITAATQKRRYEFREEPREGEDVKLVPVPILEIDQIEEKEMTILESITGWKNVYDSGGEIMPYSAKNKIRFSLELSVDDYTAWLLFIDEKRKVLAEQITKEDEEALGN